MQELKQEPSLKAKYRNLVFHGIIGTDETFDVLLDALERCQTDEQVEEWRTWALSLEPAPNYAA